MFKKITLILSLMFLAACQENDKIKVNQLLENKEFTEAKSIIEQNLGGNPQDDFYNGAMGYIISEDCLANNCVANNDNDSLKKIHYYWKKSIGLSKVEDGYFVDFYQKIMINLIKIALLQEDFSKSRLVLREFINSSNPRKSFVYKTLYNEVIDGYLNTNNQKSLISLELMQELDLDLPDMNLKSIDLLLAFSQDKPLPELKEKIRVFNRSFINSRLPEDFLAAFAPALTNYSLRNNLDSIIDLIAGTIKQQSQLFGENIFVLKQDYNIKNYAYGISLITKSNNILEKLSKAYFQDKNYFIYNLQNIVLRIKQDDADLWEIYVDSLYETNNIDKLYNNIDISKLPTDIIIMNNEKLIQFANNSLKDKAIIPVLNEVIFRADAKKDYYTQQTINLVEKALRIEIDSNNLNGIFKYLNYVPSLKEKFKDELNSKLKNYIDESWKINDFNNLSNLIKLYQDLNSVNNSDVINKLFEEFILTEEIKNFFKANEISTLIDDSKSNDIKENLNLKYEYVMSKLSKDDIQSILFSVARKIDGIYAQSKLFSFFVDVFSKNKVDDLIIDSINVALAKDSNKNLIDVVKLAGFLVNKTNKLPKNYIEREIIPLISSLEDIEKIWDNSNSSTRKYLVKYDADIANLIKVINNDNADKKITTAKYIEKITSKEILPYVANYRIKYSAYVNSIKGDYVNVNNELGPEIIRIVPTKNLLKVKVIFISQLGKIENLDIYKLDRGEIISKDLIDYFNPTTNAIKLSYNYTAKEQKLFAKNKNIVFNEYGLNLGNNKYKKVDNLFEFNTKYGVIEQITEKTQDNFHIMPEGSSFKVTEQLDKNLYAIEFNHPATGETKTVKAKYNYNTAEFSFGYDYYIKLFDKNYSAKAKCQLIDTTAYCAVQDKYWKRQKYSVVLKASQVK